MDEPEDLTPEARNASQDDAADQAQTLADEALGRSSDYDAGDTEKAESNSDEDDPSLPDLVDHMNQMVSSGRIDMSAFRGERNDDDVDDGLGEQGMEDDFPRGAE
ncbi:hypothetical protein ACFFF7_05180 [Novosphingobium aquiterrae]|uniref:Uncharacterized protein n=1 Tax=Novosphingobium aquiterrae TaxID=624388 RepID=A0ABV6PG34_9SPHN